MRKKYHNLERGLTDMTNTLVRKVTEEKKLINSLKEVIESGFSEDVHDEFGYLESLRVVSMYLRNIGTDSDRLKEITYEIGKVESNLIKDDFCPECGTGGLAVWNEREYRGECWGSPASEEVTRMRCEHCGFDC